MKDAGESYRLSQIHVLAAAPRAAGLCVFLGSPDSALPLGDLHAHSVPPTSPGLFPFSSLPLSPYLPFSSFSPKLKMGYGLGLVVGDSQANFPFLSVQNPQTLAVRKGRNSSEAVPGS